MQTKGSQSLIKWRTDRNLTQAALAAVIGVDFSTLCRWEMGERTPLRRQLDRIAQVTAGVVVPGEWGEPGVEGHDETDVADQD